MNKLLKQNGHGSVMMMVACAGVIVVWLIFNSVMGVIGDSTQKRTRERLERLNAPHKPVVVDNSPREVRGYQVAY